MKAQNKKIQVFTRLDKEDAAALKDLQQLTKRSQAETIRYAIRSTARAMQVVKKLETEKKL